MTTGFAIMNLAEIPPILGLCLLCLPPVIFTVALGLLPRRSQENGVILSGNPMLHNGNGIPAHVEPVVRPLLYLTRTHSDADLRALILGLRHMPITQTAPILKRYLHSPDPELQLYAQSILQEKQAKLQHDLARLLDLPAPVPPANLASCIEAGLNLMDSPLTPESEHGGILRKLYPKSEQVLRSDLTHPRALFAAARFCLRTHQVTHACELHDRLAPGCPLHETLGRLIAHHAAILHPPPPPTTGYQIL